MASFLTINVAEFPSVDDNNSAAGGGGLHLSFVLQVICQLPLPLTNLGVMSTSSSTSTSTSIFLFLLFRFMNSDNHVKSHRLSRPRAPFPLHSIQPRPIYAKSTNEEMDTAHPACSEPSFQHQVAKLLLLLLLLLQEHEYSGDNNGQQVKTGNGTIE